MNGNTEIMLRVVRAAVALSEAGKEVGAGYLPSVKLHALYDAVRDYQAQKRNPQAEAPDFGIPGGPGTPPPMLVPEHYQYDWILLDLGNTSILNDRAEEGWRVILSVKRTKSGFEDSYWGLLERKVRA